MKTSIKKCAKADCNNIKICFKAYIISFTCSLCFGRSHLLDMKA